MEHLNIIEERQERARQHIRANLAAALEQFSETVIEVPEIERWKYAIPDNYTNYQNSWCKNRL